MVACFAYSAAVVRWLRLVVLQLISSRRQMLKIAALGGIFCFSVVCGNASLRFLPVSFNQAVGATTPFFTTLFVLAITCRSETAGMYAALVSVVLDIVLASNSEPLFHLISFLLCLGSTAGRALKSVVQGVLLISESEKLNFMNLLMHMVPITAAILLPLSLYAEPGVVATAADKVTGFGITMVGVVLYSEAKKRSKSLSDKKKKKGDAVASLRLPSEAINTCEEERDESSKVKG